ncbi:alpha/beta hydrolase [Vibrio sp. SCSIO 43136]|uniref:alpha/beta fold hydrolase n=1 Tax=Vibrio sp. SCSIO 43136 TaxID=2819101 RepID=UPI002074DF75|nr:alpha/beta hydrolase [Vibrio sp. SCSIO 43136]USD66900.1 alpha/beta hydrolase [Vibrio sp. SCSIO 43136]
MSEKIYFNTSNKFSVKKSLVGLGTGAFHLIAPKQAKQKAKKLLLTPVRMTPKNEEPAEMRIDQVETGEGLLTRYQLGQGPAWILTHGWSGSSNQYVPLMEHIAAQGFTAIAYDHPGHGKSDGIYGSIPAFVAGLEGIIDATEQEVVGVVGHSMGTASALECRHERIANVPMLLIAPVLNYIENLFGSIERSGFSMRLFKAVVSDIEHQYHYPLHTVDPYNKLGARIAQTIIVHDEADKFAKYSVSQQADQEMKYVELVSVQGQGHGRVMKCSQVMESFDRLAKTINLAKTI